MKLKIKNREVINLTRIGQTVQNLFSESATYNPYGILLANGHQFGFQDGGCLILACAFQRLISSKGIPCELGAVMDVYEGQLRGNHFMCLVGTERSLAIDSDGIGSVAEMLMKCDILENPNNAEFGLSVYSDYQAYKAEHPDCDIIYCERTILRMTQWLDFVLDIEFFEELRNRS